LYTTFGQKIYPSRITSIAKLCPFYKPTNSKVLVSLSPAQGGIGIPDLKRESLEQFNASLDITAPHVNSIVTQSSTIPARELMEERKCKINAKRSAAAKSRIDRIDESLSPDLL